MRAMPPAEWSRRLAPSIVLAALLGAATISNPPPANAAPVLAASAEAAPRADSAARLANAATPVDEREYVAQVRAAYTPENHEYWRRRVVVGLVSPFVTIAAALVLLFSGASARLRDVATRMASGRYLRTLLYLVLLSLVLSAVELPLAWYGDFLLEHRYGLSDQSFPGWLGEQAIGLAVNLALFGVIPLVLLAYRGIERSPRRWWLWFSLATIPLSVALVLITPILIDPLTNKFVPLQDQRLKTEILALAERAGIPGRRVFQVDKSKQTKKYNAYVSGFGPSQRIVLWDTTLKGMRDDEILFVMGHEMGHYRLAHLWKGTALYSALGFLLFWLAAQSTGWAIRRFGERWRVSELADLASLPLLVVVLLLLSLVTQPIVAGVSRAMEHEADVFGLEVTRSNDAAARAFIKLASQNKSNPEPPRWLELFEYDHPTPIERIRFAATYHPWTEGQPNRAYRPR